MFCVVQWLQRLSFSYCDHLWQYRKSHHWPVLVCVTSAGRKDNLALRWVHRKCARWILQEPPLSHLFTTFLHCLKTTAKLIVGFTVQEVVTGLISGGNQLGEIRVFYLQIPVKNISWCTYTECLGPLSFIDSSCCFANLPGETTYQLSCADDGILHLIYYEG